MKSRKSKKHFAEYFQKAYLAKLFVYLFCPCSQILKIVSEVQMIVKLFLKLINKYQYYSIFDISIKRTDDLK